MAAAVPLWREPSIDRVVIDSVAHLAPPEWMRDAACLEHDPNLWFPARGADTRAAKQVCAGCLVRDECAAFADDAGIEFGIWAGESRHKRNSRRR
jgi:WhiB family transcriptional regulator, redox-sensing transcriptional regulator